MAKSIMQKTKECYICRLLADEHGYYGDLPATGLHKHHVVFGMGNRKLSERYGLWVYLCEHLHHEHGEYSAHESRGIRRMLCEIAQREFEAKNPTLSFSGIFGKSYIEPGEDLCINVIKRAKDGSKTQL